MPSNDTPPRPFVPKTEAEREQIVHLVALGVDKGTTLMSGLSAASLTKYAERIVPKVPTQRRRVSFDDTYAFEFAKLGPNGGPMFQPYVNGERTHCTDDFRIIVFTYATGTQAAKLGALLLDLAANPDEPAQPAAAQGGAKLTWAQFVQMHDDIRVVMTAGSLNDDVTPAELASLNAKLSALLGAVPVGRALTNDEMSNVLSAYHEAPAFKSIFEPMRAAIRKADALRGLAPTVTP